MDLPKGVALITGKTHSILEHLEGHSNKIDVDAVYASSLSDNRARAQWVLDVPEASTVKMSIKSERAGTIEREIILA